MITIHATKKLHSKLPLDDQGFIPSKDTNLPPDKDITTLNPLSNWHANLITLLRRNCILLVHDATRFLIFMKVLVKDDFPLLQKLVFVNQPLKQSLVQYLRGKEQNKQ